jgi:hypothetical protein
MFIPIWVLVLILIWFSIEKLRYSLRVRKELKKLHDSMLNPDWIAWKKTDDEMERREGCRQWSQTEPIKYLSPEDLKVRKAQITARPVIMDEPWSREDQLALERFRIFSLVQNYDGYVAYMNVMHERTRKIYPDARLQLWTKEQWDREYEVFRNYQVR